MGERIRKVSVAETRRVGTATAKSPFIVKKDSSSLPQTPTALHTTELFKKSDEAVNHLKYRETVKGAR